MAIDLMHIYQFYSIVHKISNFNNTFKIFELLTTLLAKIMILFANLIIFI